MGIEQGEVDFSPSESLKQLEKELGTKEPRLPSSIRKYIRALKQAGRWDEAMEIRNRLYKQTLGRKSKTREERAEEELNRTIKQILITQDPQVQAENEAKAIWLLNVTGVINKEERMQELLALLDSKADNLKDFLEGRLGEIRDQALKI